MSPPVVVIGNPTSGQKGSPALLESCAEHLRRRLGDVELLMTERPGHARELAAAAGDTLVVAAGGDGTVNEVVNGLSPGATLGIIPLGTANVLAQELGIPLDPEAACERISGRRGTVMDLGVATDARGASRLFACMAGIGFDARVVQAVDPALKHRLGKSAFVLTAVRLYLTGHFPPCRLHIEHEDGYEKVIEKVRLAVLANVTHYGGPFLVSSRADLMHSGELDLVVVERISSLLRPDILLPFMARTPLDHSIRSFDVTRARASSMDGRSIPVQLDGEPWGTLPMTFGVRPGALRVIC
ncbi:diacylglycerol/lipid kinase family protein [Rubrobacter naiadicus]|uniref:diacylglycerol/lipid kinase family protein n=1 Tax=Rubrobacter naiadicus TaxID=1392641 RepID=UPI00236116A3|nr:diacylglycerol kinase family protein [Rubrobacter naiadicus]